MKKDLSCFLVSALLMTFTLQSCKEDEENTSPPVDYSSEGVYIVNEGGFLAGNASVSYFDTETKTVTNDIFQSTNGFPLGDVAQSMTLHNGKGYIVVNNSQKIEVVNLTGFTTAGTITGLSSPRYMAVWNNKGYVSEWLSNDVKVVDLSSNAVVKSIPAGSGPEHICISNNRVYVSNIGGLGTDSTVTVINPATDSVIASIPVGLNPNSVAADLNGSIWVLCGGSLGPDYTPSTGDDIAGSIWKINPSSLTSSQVLQFAPNVHPLKLRSDGTGRYMHFLSGTSSYNGMIVRFDAVPSNTVLVTVVNRNFYGLGIDPGSGYVYGGMAPDFTQNGWVFRYQGSGVLIDSVQAGIAPGFFAFKP